MHRTLYIGVSALQAPEYLKRVILARGGVNPFGEPNYRVVRCCARYRLSGGKWYEWPKWMPQAERIPGMNLPLSTWVGTKPVLLYALEMDKWVIERWMPPSYYGKRDMWYQPVELGGTVRYIDDKVILGAGHFPHMGDYESCNYFLPNDAVVEAVVANIIGRIERQLDETPMSARQRYLNEIAAGEQEEKMKQDAFDKFAADELGAAQQEYGLDARTAEAQGEVNKIIESVKHTGSADVERIKRYGVSDAKPTSFTSKSHWVGED